MGTKELTLTNDEKYNAVINNDKSCDGVFFYGVKSTMIFCKPSCASKNPLPANTLYFESYVQAIAQGYRPCKRCRPDKIDYRPDEEAVSQTAEYIDKNYSGIKNMRQLSSELGVSANHLARVFKKLKGCTPKKYLERKRIEEAKLLLERGHHTILDVANNVGFGSVSSFYKSFKDITGITPKKFRNKNIPYKSIYN